jgi:hypothetical protein
VVRIEALLHLVGKDLLRARIAELPHIDGVEPEVVLAVRAKGNGLDVVFDLALAVVPETDEVKVLELVGLGRALQRFEQLVVDLNVVGEVVDHIVRVVIEFPCVRLSWRVRTGSLNVVLSRRCAIWATRLRLEREHTLKKYKSLCSLLLLFICPLNTRVRQMKPATTNAMGVKMHAKRPSLPMLARVPSLCSLNDCYPRNQSTLSRWPNERDKQT